MEHVESLEKLNNMEKVTNPQDIQIEDSILSDDEMAPQVICFDAEGRAESVKLKVA